MGDHIVVLLLSVIVLLGALYVYKVEQNIVQIKDELLQHGIEIKKVKEELQLTNKAHIQDKVELESTRKELAQVKVELESTDKEVTQAQVELKSTKKELKQVKGELESTKQEVKQVKVELDTTRNELKQVKVELDTTRNELKHVKQVKVELDTEKEQINILRKEMIDKDNACNIEINQIRANVNTLREELNKINTGGNNRPAFTATLTTHPLRLSGNDIVKFDNVILNRKDGYDSKTGKFTAPSSGLYQFSFTIMSDGGSSLHMVVVKNGKSIMNLYGSNIHGATETANPILELEKDDSVYLTHGHSASERMVGNHYSHISAYYIGE